VLGHRIPLVEGRFGTDSLQLTAPMADVDEPDTGSGRAPAPSRSSSADVGDAEREAGHDARIVARDSELAENLASKLADVNVSIKEHFELLKTSVNLPISGVGRVIDIFDKMSASITVRLQEFCRDEFAKDRQLLDEEVAYFKNQLASSNKRAADRLQSETTRLAKEFDASLAATVAELKEEGRRLVGEANEREHAVRQQLDSLNDRSSNIQQVRPHKTTHLACLSHEEPVLNPLERLYCTQCGLWRDESPALKLCLLALCGSCRMRGGWGGRSPGATYPLVDAEVCAPC
jgi:hypothetical protein